MKILDEKDLQAIAQLMDMRLKPINERLDSMDGRLDSVDSRLDFIEERLSNVEEDTKITRSAVNNLLEWADDASVQAVPIFRRKAK